MRLTLTRRYAVLVACAVLLAGCNTTPQRPPPPKPREVTQPEPPPPPPARTAPQQQHSESTASSAAEAGEYGPRSSNAAEVEIEEINADGSTTRVQPSAAANQAAGGGGSPAPLYGGGTPAPAGSPEDAGVVELGGGGASANADLVGPAMNIGARTGPERVAALDAELNQQLSDFDERMRRARTAAAEERALRASGGGAPQGAAGGRGQRRSNPDGERGAGGAATRASGAGNTPDLSGEAGGGNQVAAYPPPGGIGDGKDDDIVARQLREAATKEPDPLLREKLWEEYRSYKAGL